MNELKIAEQIAREVHKGQKRTIGRKEDYIEHPKRMANSFSTDEHKIISWLHDVLEDSNLTPRDLIDRGITEQLVGVIDTLTRKDEPYINYILRIKQNESTRIIKIADIKDNLIKLSKGTLRDKYLLALCLLE